MRSRTIQWVWVLLAVGAVVLGVLALSATPITTETIGAIAWVFPAVGFVLVVTALTLVAPQRLQRLRRVLAWGRVHPIGYWLLVLVYCVYLLGHWIWHEQPTNGRLLTPVELCFLCCFVWGLLFLLLFDLDTEGARAYGRGVAQSKLSGLMLMLTTAILIFGCAEAYLRIFYITTDAYGFTAMNYHWYKNFYWGHENSLGYRDHEPKVSEDGSPLKTVAIVGDSFAAGHGIDNIDETFPQLLEQKLGAGWDVNLVAQSGWDSDVETAWLNSYAENMKHAPQVVVLSYYLNDIDYLLTDTATNPDAVFTFPENPTLYWFVLNFFVPNYIYYNLLQFTSPVRNTNFTDRLIRAHLDDAIWSQQEANLQLIADWTHEHESKLVVLLWPQLAAIPQSKPALDRVRQFFEGQGASIVDMSDWLNGHSTSELILNRFDSHPSRLSNAIAAEGLYQAIAEQKQ